MNRGPVSPRRRKGIAKVFLTADYELFGNGTGCIHQCLLNPAERMMATAEESSARVTFFVDVLEVMAFEKAEQAGHYIGVKDAAERIRNQLTDTVRRGHDVQLHLHPQWIDARWVPGFGWELNMDYWRIGGLATHIGQDRLESVVAGGVDWLESLLKPFDPAYRCRSFRAGAWSIQPEADVLSALRRSGIVIDTTVAPGCFARGQHTWFDFRDAPEARWRGWRIAESVTEVDDMGKMYELPIYTAPIPIRTRLRKRRTPPVPSWPPGCEGRTVEASIPARGGRIAKAWARGRSALARRPIQFDFCSLAECELDWMLGTVRKYPLERHHMTPIVAISHPKAFSAPKRLKHLLARIEQMPDISVDRVDHPSLWRSEEVRDIEGALEI